MDAAEKIRRVSFERAALPSIGVTLAVDDVYLNPLG
jgi:hypothetical protein